MPWAKATDIAYGRLRAPDLDVMEEFLTRFGMRRSERTNNALYMRGTDPRHHIHVTEKGDPKFVGLAYYVESEDELSRLTKAPGASGIEIGRPQPPIGDVRRFGPGHTVLLDYLTPRQPRPRGSRYRAAIYCATIDAAPAMIGFRRGSRRARSRRPACFPSH